MIQRASLLRQEAQDLAGLRPRVSGRRSGVVVLLHLSRQCNAPDRAASFHAGAPYRVTVARHDAPTGVIHIA